jgi:SEC-C motif-containing protein
VKAKTGRNDPCPWGSEKKFKKCCLTNGGAALVSMELEEIDAQLKVYANTGAKTCKRKSGVPSANFVQQREEFVRMLEAADELDGETVFYVANKLFLSADACDERGTVNECLERLRDLRPGLYFADAVLYVKWIAGLCSSMMWKECCSRG